MKDHLSTVPRVTVWFLHLQSVRKTTSETRNLQISPSLACGMKKQADLSGPSDPHLPSTDAGEIRYLHAYLTVGLELLVKFDCIYKLLTTAQVN